MTGTPSRSFSGQKLARKVEIMRETIAAVKRIGLGGVDLQKIVFNIETPSQSYRLGLKSTIAHVTYLFG